MSFSFSGFIAHAEKYFEKDVEPEIVTEIDKVESDIKAVLAIVAPEVGAVATTIFKTALSDAIAAAPSGNLAAIVTAGAAGAAAGLTQAGITLEPEVLAAISTVAAKSLQLNAVPVSANSAPTAGAAS